MRVLLKWGIFCGVFGILTALIYADRSQRERRLRRHGRRTTAICRDHLNAEGDGPIRVRCGFRLSPEHKGEYTVVVQTRERIPRIGEEIRIVYDPQDPSNAENAEFASMPSFGRHDIIVLLGWVGIYLVSVSCVAVAD